MALIEKYLPIHLSKSGMALLQNINEGTLKQSTAYLVDLNKVIPKNKRDRLIQSFAVSIKGVFQSWIRKVKKETQELNPSDRIKVLLYLAKELSIQTNHSEDFPFFATGKGKVLSEIVRANQITCFEMLRDEVNVVRDKTEKKHPSVNEAKGNRKIVWLGSKPQLENLIDNLVSHQCIKEEKNKSGATEVFLSYFKDKDQALYVTSQPFKKLQLDKATGKVIGGIMRELINKGWILQSSPTYTKDSIAEIVSKIFIGTTKKTIKNGMAMHFEDDNNNPLEKVEDRNVAGTELRPFDKIKPFDLRKFKQAPSKYE